jgi:hypothetical protein
VTGAATAGPAGDHSRIVNHVLAPSPGVYAIDPVHTFVGFAAHHLVVGRFRGRFERVAGTVTITEELTSSSLEGTVETASMSTLFGARNQDLRSDRFLDSDAYPTMTYRRIGVIERPGMSGVSGPSHGEIASSNSKRRQGACSLETTSPLPSKPKRPCRRNPAPASALTPKISGNHPPLHPKSVNI